MIGRELLVGAIFGGLVLAACRMAIAAPFDVYGFRSLAPQEQRLLLLAALHEREAKLRNFEYEAVERSVNHNSNARSSTVNRVDTYTMKRNGDKQLIHLRLGNATGDVHSDGVTAWDGKRAKSLTRFTNAPDDLRGMVQDAENNNFGYRLANQAIGFRSGSEGRQSLAEWMQTHGNEGVQAEIVVNSEGGKTLLQWRTSDQYRKFSFTFDPEKDFMLVRREYHYELRGNFNKHVLRVTESKEIDGLWVPTSITKRNGTSAKPGVETEISCEIPQFRLGTVTDRDVELVFPAGTEVVDAVAGVAYRVLPNGGSDPLATINSLTGEVTDASADRTELTAVTAHEPPASNPLASAEVPPAVRSSTAGPHRLWWLAAVSGVGFLVVAAWVAFYPRKHVKV